MELIVAKELEVFCARRGIPDAQVRYVPAVFERAAKQCRVQLRALIRQATYYNDVGEYMAEVIGKVANEMEAEQCK